MSRQLWSKGSILEIELSTGEICTCQMLDHPEFAFFAPDDMSNPVFRLWVHKSAYTTGRWKKIGKAEIPPELSGSLPRFGQDTINGSFSIYQSGVERSATLSECLGLERAAVWEPSHVEERLVDHRSGRPNKWVQSLAPRTDA